jgi:hypothetical protein
MKPVGARRFPSASRHLEDTMANIRAPKFLDKRRPSRAGASRLEKAQAAFNGERTRKFERWPATAVTSREQLSALVVAFQKEKAP